MLCQYDIVSFGGEKHFMWALREVDFGSCLDEAGCHWVIAKWAGHHLLPLMFVVLVAIEEFFTAHIPHLTG